ncbi:MAG TPA: hypothetical protein VMF32_21245 [Xanthobacteraceae bacterium]|nr:hypothetical protein [Xanthobacteraceae bacterium]
MKAKSWCAGLFCLLAALALAGCSGGGMFGGPKRDQPPAAVDLNGYPSNYRKQIATLLSTLLTERADFHGALIAQPELKPVAESSTPHYVVCVQLNGHNRQRTKVAVFLGGDPTQFIDATPEQCTGVAYQSFTELELESPQK